jgi:dinuclear metal center YbgI/SA1388 family protein
MTIATVFEQLERFAPTALAQDWDNVGILIGDSSRRVKKILISLDASPNVVNYAVDQGFDLILSHHPLIFKPLKSVTHPVILQMVENKIGLISMHTNFDSAIGGVNHALAESLEMEILESLGEGDARDIGLICSYQKSFCLSEIASFVKEKLNASGLRFWTAGWDDQQEIRRIAVCGGAGGSVLALAEQKADLLITGDISYHSFLDSHIPIIDAGHFATEYPALKTLQDFLAPTGIPSEIFSGEKHEWQLFMRYL